MRNKKTVKIPSQQKNKLATAISIDTNHRFSHFRLFFLPISYITNCGKYQGALLFSLNLAKI